MAKHVEDLAIATEMIECLLDNIERRIKLLEHEVMNLTLARAYLANRARQRRANS